MKRVRAVYCTVSGVKVTLAAEGSPRDPIPHADETDQWGSGACPAHRQTDVYLFHEVCWHHLVEHFSPHEMRLDCLFQALERMPLLWNEYNYTLPPVDFAQVTRDGRLCLPSVDELMRFARPPPVSSHRTIQRLLSTPPQTKDALRRLPFELIETIAALLPTRDVLNLRHASRGVTPIFASTPFWKTRFYLNGERGFLLPVVRGQLGGGSSRRRDIDWRLLYHSTCQLNCSGWFRLELRKWEALRWLRDTALALHSGTDRPLDFRGAALHHYHHTVPRGTSRQEVESEDGSHVSWRYPGLRVTMDVVDFRGFNVNDSLDGIRGVYIVQGSDECRNCDTDDRYDVGHSPGWLAQGHPSRYSLDEVFRVTAVCDVGSDSPNMPFKSRKIIDIGVLGRAGNRLTLTRVAWQDLVLEGKNAGDLPTDLELR
ncbi:F-box domain protein [Aspergillus homomorphus CBS 101889]|uniref:Uncharacterized protein n=1 Tax=Aspergillus homomorphus (strain CBS 101889) TaxID=1450537 RepID=A0A395I7J6_ASPHC|nr:hypothetical protein BO97DRAFT_421419 [Aspergillus homomorphus CBS 101889]RAL16192.1 hypothetical protein BO97DRAFT_421419 [Aspergillus homomorphus CBS 101889]